MTQLVWDAVGERLYETGVKKGVLYPQAPGGTYPLGIAWNGLASISESPSGAEASPIYADDTKYLNLVSAEEFGATIEAYTYPEEFGVCDGSAEIATGVLIGQQARTPFGLAYRTALGNDTEGESYGYKLHLIYGALAAPSEKGYQTINDSPEAITFSWEVSTTPVAVTDFRPTASLVIDSTKVDKDTLAALEDILYGTEAADPVFRCPMRSLRCLLLPRLRLLRLLVLYLMMRLLALSLMLISSSRLTMRFRVKLSRLLKMMERSFLVLSLGMLLVRFSRSTPLQISRLPLFTLSLSPVLSMHMARHSLRLFTTSRLLALNL